MIFTLAISCFTTSNLPWLIGLTFQVPMQYCSLQHWTLLPSPVTFTTTHCFSFDSISSFLLESFLYSSPVAFWSPTDLGSSYFTVIFICLFRLFMVGGGGWILKARTLNWFAIPLFNGLRFFRTLHHDPPILGGPTWHGS